jgi:hypothetical protein
MGDYWKGLERRSNLQVGKNWGRRKTDRPDEKKAAEEWYPFTPVTVTYDDTPRKGLERRSNMQVGANRGRRSTDKPKDSDTSDLTSWRYVQPPPSGDY